MFSDEGSEQSSSSSALTEEQESFIKECEEEFVNRYTVDDLDYKNLKENGVGDPPIVTPWYNKPRRNFNWADKSRGDHHRNHNRNNYNRREDYHGNKYKSRHDYRNRPY